MKRLLNFQARERYLATVALVLIGCWTLVSVVVPRGTAIS